MLSGESDGVALPLNSLSSSGVAPMNQPWPAAFASIVIMSSIVSPSVASGRLANSVSKLDSDSAATPAPTRRSTRLRRSDVGLSDLVPAYVNNPG